MAASPPPKRRRTGQIGDGDDAVDASVSPKLSPVVVFAHGAGSPSTSEWMIRWKKMLEKAVDAVEVVTFDYPYLAGGKRRAPPKAEKEINGLKGVKGAIRDEILVQLATPVIFIQGSKDSLCPLDELEAVRKKMKSPTQLHVVKGGDHSFKIAKKQLATGSTQEDALQGAIQAIADFVTSSLHGG